MKFKTIVVFLIVLVVLLLLSYAVQTNDRINFKTEKITYVEDERTGIIYAVISSRRSFEPQSSGLGVTVIPEEYRDRVKDYIEER